MSRSVLLVLGLLSLNAAGCVSCSGDELFAGAERGELRAIHDLGELGDPVVPPPQTYALRNLDEAFVALRPHLAHENPFHRLVALESVRRLAQRAQGLFRTRFADLLDPALRDPDPELRWRAAWALGRVELSRPGLREATRDRDLRVAERALWALGQARDREALPDLLAALDRPAPLPARAVQALRVTTGLRLETPERWRAWAKTVGSGAPTEEATPARPQGQ